MWEKAVVGPKPRKQAGMTWEEAAQQLGESLLYVEPESYYELTPKEWLAWAHEALRQLGVR